MKVKACLNYIIQEASLQINCAPGACAASGWVGVNFLHSSLYGAMFCICDQNSLIARPCFSCC